MKAPGNPIYTLMDNAYSTIDLCNEVLSLRERVAELECYEQKYHDLLNSSIKHSDAMMAEQMRLLCTPGVLDALGKDRKC